MPELPEVETVRRGLAPHMERRVLARVEQRRPDLRFPLPAGFVERLTGRRVLRLGRRAKYLLVHLEDGAVLIAHLGMSGSFVVTPARGPATNVASASFPPPEELANTPGARRPQHDHVVFHLDDGGCVTFNDPRRFGYMLLDREETLEQNPRLAGIGPEPLGNGFSGPVLAAALAGRLSPIKAALLDQKVVAGLGNIYVCEALFRAGISPKRTAATVQGARAERLAEAIRAVLADAIEAGGSSLRDFVHASGELGYFQHRFAVYGREGEACPDCTCDRTILRIVQSGRSTFYCARRQR